MVTTKLTGTLIKSGSIPVSALGGGVVSSSTQVTAGLPTGIISSSAQYPGWVTSSTQIDYNNIQNKLSGVVSSSVQVQPLLPNGTVSSSAQYSGWVTASSQVLLNAITGTSFSNNAFYFPNDLRVEGNLTAQQIYTEYVSSSVIYESGSTKFGDTTDDVMSVTGSILVLGGRISGSMTGMFSASAQVDYNSITNKLSGTVSSSTQIQPLLPGGAVSSSAQYPGWVTSSTQIMWSSVNYSSGIMSSSAQTVTNLVGQTVTLSGSQFSSIVSGSGLAYRLVVPVGTNYYAT